VVVEQVVNFASINFIHGDSHGEVSLVILPVVDTTLKQVLHCIVLKALHRECLARARLPVGENGDRARVEDQVEDGFHTEPIQLLIRLVLAKRVVKLKVLVFDKFGDSIYFVPAIVHDDVRVGDRNDIDFTTR